MELFLKNISEQLSAQYMTVNSDGPISVTTLYGSSEFLYQTTRLDKINTTTTLSQNILIYFCNHNANKNMKYTNI